MKKVKIHANNLLIQHISEYGGEKNSLRHFTN